jgi:PAS domain S-box-containing protein
LKSLFSTLPLEISFVDENDQVRFYSETPERIFPRSPGVIGRKVQNCHPPKSLHIVQRLLDAFRSGEKDSADFWIQSQGKFILIRYFAVRDKEGHYKGTIEVTQDITAIRALEGERRLLDWEK